MKIKNYCIKSNFLNGSAIVYENQYEAKIEIDVKIFGFIDSDSVIKVYFENKDTKELKSIGIIDNFGHLTKTFDKSILTDTIVFVLKNTISETKEKIAYGYFEDELLSQKTSPIENAKKILDEIKQTKTNTDIDFDNVLKNITNEIKENIKNYKLIKCSEIKDFDIYKITDFKPMSNISSVKYTMFEKSAIYSFDFCSHYLFGIKENKLFIAFASNNGLNPLSHLNDLTTYITINNLTYYYVIIELLCDGQYFIKE